MKLAERPAANLRALMVTKGEELELEDGFGRFDAVSARAVARGAWPGEDEGTTKGRVESLKGGRWVSPEHVEAIAAYFGVDAGRFYQEPGQ